MFLAYDGIVFDVLLLDDWQREFEYSEDKTTFLWIKHTITVTCVLNVDATAANRFPPVFGIVVKPKDSSLIGELNPVRNAKPNDAGSKPRGDLTPALGGGGSAAPLAGADAGFGGSGDFGPGGGLPTGGTVIPPAGVLPNPALGTAIGGGTFVPGLFPPKPPNSGGSFTPLPPPPGGFGGNFNPPRLPQPKPVKFGGDAAKNKKGPQQNPNIADKIQLNNIRPTVPNTDIELRQRLRRARRQLLIWIHSGPNAAPEFMLASPLHADAGSDAQHGPICTIMDMPEIWGVETAILKLQFVTWEAPALEFNFESPGPSEPVLSPQLRAIQQLLADDAQVLKLIQAAQNPKSVEGRAWAAAFKIYAEATFAGNNPVDASIFALETGRQIGLDEADAQRLAKIIQAQNGQDDGPKILLEDILNGVAAKKKILATPAVLSHRWSMAFGWNPETYLRTQNIEGEVIFRMDVLRMRGLTADQLRAQWRHPIPEGYQRRPVGDDDIKLSEGGNAIQYRIIDDQVMMNFPGGLQWGLIHVEADEEMEYHGYGAGGLGGTPIAPTPSPQQGRMRANK